MINGTDKTEKKRKIVYAFGNSGCSRTPLESMDIYLQARLFLENIDREIHEAGLDRTDIIFMLVHYEKGTNRNKLETILDSYFDNKRPQIELYDTKNETVTGKKINIEALAVRE